MKIEVTNHSTLPSGDAAGVVAQAETGIDWASVPTPGDPLSGHASTLSGARSGDAVSVPFRAYPCRGLRIQSRLRNRRRVLQPAYLEAQALGSIDLKLSLSGPYTLSKLSKLETTAYRERGDLALDLANHLADEVRAAVDAGARMVQIDEPWILQEPKDIREVRTLLEPIQDAVEPHAMLIVSTYGGPVGEMFAHLNSLPGAAVALDCVSSADMIDDLAATGSGKPLALGLVGDGANPSAGEIARQVERATRRYIHDVLYLQPAWGLDAVDAATALAKLALLVEARDLLNGR